MDVIKLPHHERRELCTTRASYRQGRKFTAVKVYTINDESQHLIISHVPALGLQNELRKLCSRYGDVVSLVFIPNYEEEEFTEAYHVQYSRIQSARFAKGQLDDKSFFGGLLHVCYVPEMESIDETRAKLLQRRREVARKTRGEQLGRRITKHSQQLHRQKKHPALPLTAERLSAADVRSSHCIWQGIPREIDPRILLSTNQKNETVYGPVQLDKKWLEAGVRERKITSVTKPKSGSSLSVMNSYGGRKVYNFGSSPVLKFIPTQVKSARRIVFRNRTTKDGSDKSEDMFSKESSSGALGNLSIEEVILSVRKKVKAVCDPSNQLALKQKD